MGYVYELTLDAAAEIDAAIAMRDLYCAVAWAQFSHEDTKARSFTELR